VELALGRKQGMSAGEKVQVQQQLLEG